MFGRDEQHEGRPEGLSQGYGGKAGPRVQQAGPADGISLQLVGFVHPTSPDAGEAVPKEGFGVETVPGNVPPPPTAYETLNPVVSGCGSLWKRVFKGVPGVPRGV